MSSQLINGENLAKTILKKLSENDNKNNIYIKDIEFYIVSEIKNCLETQNKLT